MKGRRVAKNVRAHQRCSIRNRARDWHKTWLQFREVERLLAEAEADDSPMINLAAPGALDNLRKQLGLCEREDGSIDLREWGELHGYHPDGRE